MPFIDAFRLYYVLYDQLVLMLTYRAMQNASCSQTNWIHNEEIQPILVESVSKSDPSCGHHS